MISNLDYFINRHSYDKFSFQRSYFFYNLYAIFYVKAPTLTCARNIYICINTYYGAPYLYLITIIKAGHSVKMSGHSMRVSYKKARFL